MSVLRSDRGLSDAAIIKEEQAAFSQLDPTPLSDDALETCFNFDFWDLDMAVSLLCGLQPHARNLIWAERKPPVTRDSLAHRIVLIRNALEVMDIARDEQGQLNRTKLLSRIECEMESRNPLFSYNSVNALLQYSGSRSADIEFPVSRSNALRCLAYLSLLYREHREDDPRSMIDLTTAVSGISSKIRLDLLDKTDAPKTISYKTVERALKEGYALLGLQWDDTAGIGDA